MVTVLKEKGIFAGVNLFSKQDTMDITDMFKIPLFKNFTLKMREEFLDKLEYTVEASKRKNHNSSRDDL